MKSIKKTISIIAALAILITTLTVAASLPASAEDTATEAPVYFTKFTADNFVGFGEYQRGEDGFDDIEDSTDQTRVQEGVVSYPIDGAVDIAAKSTDAHGVRTIFKIDDTAKNYFKQLEDEAAAKYEENVKKAKEKAEKQGKEFKIEDVATVYPSVKCTYFVKDSVTSKGIDIDTFVGFAFILKDGTVCDTGLVTGGNKYRTRTDTIPIRKKVIVDGETKYEAINLEDIEAVRLDIYHWNPSFKEVIFSGLTVSGKGELPERDPIELGDEKTAVAFNFDKNYRRDYAPSPKEIIYSDVENPEGEDGTKTGFNKRGNPGWMKWQCESASQQYQSAYWFDRDQFDYALALANRTDENGNLIGSGKFLITIGLESCVDAAGNPVKAEVQVNFSTYDHGYQNLVYAWQNPGETVQYEIDVSKLERSDVAQIVITVQNYWYYDKDGNVVEYPESGKEVDVDLGDGETSKTMKYGTGVKSIGGIIPQVKVSPITVMEPNHVITTAATKQTTMPTTTKAPTQEIEGAGYHFFDYEEDCRMAGYGNQAIEPIKYYNDSSKDDPNIIYTEKDDDFYGGFKMKSPLSNLVGKQYQQCWTTITAKATNDDKVEIETVITPEYGKKLKNKMAQALAYANAPNAPGMLAYKVKVNSAKNGTYKLSKGKPTLLSGNGEDCTVQIGVQIMCYDEFDSVVNFKYQAIGGVQTHFIDVSELTVDKIKQIHPMAQNYANVDQETGNACGLYDIDVDFSAIYVAGNGAGTPTKTQAPTANNSEVEAIYAIYKQLPGLNPSDYQTEADWALLEKFITACYDATVQTMNGLEAKGVTSEIIGRLQEIFFGTAGGFDDGPDTGATAAPIAAVIAAAAAGFVFMKLRKK
ncbi:MAG: hypothetical protein ACI396_08290 [Acutalibacteraceae bacterium]